MNKRIREVVRKLAEQAYVEHRQEYFCDNDDPTITSVSVTRHFDREKFAELIVRECAEVCSKSQFEPFYEDHYDGNHVNLIIKEVTGQLSKEIERHFGVE
jgi:hypothetical protein